MPSADNKRLAKNTLFLYVRMFLVMGVGLFTSRVILNALGVNDFGIYNVIGGMVSLFSIVSSSLTSAISRYLTVEIGRDNLERLKKVFSTALTVQLFISVLIIIFLSPVGFWFLNYKMNIAPQRMGAANWVLLFSILSFIMALISVPYNACIVAHERMKAFAYVSIIEVMLKLGVAYLMYAFKHDRLIFYALLIFSISLIQRIIYGVYCTRNFIECKSKIHYYKDIFKEMSSYAGWTFIGNTSAIFQRQGSNIIINIIYGTVLNAAYGIGNQVSNAITNFANNFFTALNPQITKAYAKSEIKNLESLIFRGSRLGFFLLWFLGVIILFNTEYILKFWLKEVPEFSVQFVQLFIIFALLQTITAPVITALMSTGNIKTYQICVGGFRFINLPICYIVLKQGFPAYYAVVISIVIEVILIYLRLIFLKKEINIPINAYFNNVILRVLSVIFLNVILIKILIHFNVDNFGKLILYSVISFTISAVCIFIIGLKKDEKSLITSKILSFIGKYK